MADGQTDRQIYVQTAYYTNGQTDRQTDDRWTDGHMHRLADRHMDR